MSHLSTNFQSLLKRTKPIIKNYSILFIILVPYFSFAQTGPGGVGNRNGSSTLKVWLRADDLDADGDITDNPAKGAQVSSWSDYSGNANHYTQTGGNRPLYVTDVFNAISFDAAAATPQYLNATNVGSYSNTSVFFVTNPVNISPSHVLFDSPSESLRLEQWSNTNRIGYTRYGIADYTSSLVSPFGINSIIQFHKSAGSTTLDIRSNNSSSSINIGSTTAGVPYDRLGKNSSGADDITGNFFEVILFDNRVNNAQRIIIENYLSAKYGSIPISENYYTQDDVGAGNFDFDVAGIGQATDGSNHTNSRGTGIVTMFKPSTINNDDYLFWGRNNQTNYSFTTNTGNYKQRISSNWRVSKRNDLGTVIVQFDLSGIDLSGRQSCSPLQLIVDNNSDLLSPTATYNLVNVFEDLYEAKNVSFSDGDYFTIEYLDQIVVDGTKFYNGSGSSNVPNTSDDCYKLLVKNTADGSLPLTESADVREVEVESGGKLVVNTNMRLQIANGINNNGEIRMIGNSQIVQTHTGANINSGNGTLYQDQTSVTTNTYQSGYWTSPVTTNGSTFTISGVLKDGSTPTSATSTPSNITFTDIHTLDGSNTSPITLSGRWLARLNSALNWTKQISPTTATFSPGEGWNMKGPLTGPQNYTFVGRINNGNYSLTIKDARLSLIGNPYPSAINADQFITDNSSAIAGVLYFWNAGNQTSHNHADYTGGYHTRVNGMGTPSGTTPISGTNFFIPVGQGFFVYRNASNGGGTGAPGSSATINFTNSQRAFRRVTDSDSQFFGRSNTSSFPILRLEFGFNLESSNTYQREVAIGFRGLTSNYENGYDAPMFDLNPSDVALKVNDKGNAPYVITGIQNFNASMEIPLIVYLDQSRQVYFKTKQKENLSTKVFIKDVVTNTYYDISKEGLSISLQLESGTYTDRFFIVFANNTLSTEEELLNQSKIYFDNSSRSIHAEVYNNLMIHELELYNYLGQKIIKSDFENPTSKVVMENLNLKPSIYIIKCNTNKGSIYKRILITL